MIWNLITMFVGGLIYGWIAKLIVPGKENFGWLATAALGIVGSFVGGTLASLVFSPHHLSLRQPVAHGIIGGIIGSVIALVVYNFLFAKKKV